MSKELLEFDMPENINHEIKVIGVGGGGSNAVNYMYNQGITGVNFIICNTDAQALGNSPVPTRIQLGESLTGGRGAGSKPHKGKASAEENIEDVKEVLKENTQMAFITAGMGGGTGTGAAPIIAAAAREMGILTVGIVTIPFKFEGKERISQALDGIMEMEKNVDSLLVINNEKLKDLYGNLTLTNAFAKADDVLTIAAKGIAEIITIHGHVNVDFEDVKTVMKDSGVAIMGSALGEGENRAMDAITKALESPLLNSNNIKGAKNILLNITSGEEEITMDEVDIITNFLVSSVGDAPNVIFGTGKDESLKKEVNITVIATGFNTDTLTELKSNSENKSNINVVDINGEPIDHNENTEVSEENLYEKRLNKFYGNNKKQKEESIDVSFSDDKNHNNINDISDKGYEVDNLNNADYIEKFENIPAYQRRLSN